MTILTHLSLKTTVFFGLWFVSDPAPGLRVVITNSILPEEKILRSGGSQAGRTLAGGYFFKQEEK